jgi:rhamnosyltransferase
MIGGFSEEVIVNEDMLFCAKFLNVGETVTYTSEASVYHSHNYSLEMLFRRYFDIGVFFAQGAVEMAGISAEGEGFRFIIRSIQTLLTQRKFQWIPRLFIETIVKIIAFWVGISYKHLTPAFCSHLSTQPFFWLPDRVNEK